jgi:hypothetical protein
LLRPLGRELGLAPNIDELIRSTPKITAVRVGTYLRKNVDADLHVDERTLRDEALRSRAASGGRQNQL